MKIPNGFFGNGPGRDEQNTRDQDAYLRNRMQMTVATSTFAGVALVGMFCSCIWFACCRNSSSKTRKKPRTWATANPEAGLQNPYNYDGYMDGEGYMQMNNSEGSAAPYVSNSLYPSGPVYGDNGLTNAYDFNDHFGFNQGGKPQMNTLFGGPTSAYAAPVTGTTETNLKDVPPSYTALFFAASDPSTGINGKGMSSAGADIQASSTDPRVTNIQPIHLKVNSSAEQEKRRQGSQETETRQEKKMHEKHGCGFYDEEDLDDDFLNMKHDSREGPVSLMSVESDPGKDTKDADDKEKKIKNTDIYSLPDERRENPPPYNPGYNTSTSHNLKF